MKKIFSIIAAVLFAGSMFAADATIAKGTTNSYDDVTVNGKKAVKMGKSSAGGDMTITVGAGSTSLKFHAVGWKGESDQVTITAPSGVTISPTAITVQANDNVAGAGKEFTVTPEEDYEFTFAITGATDGAVFTLESAKRAIVWAATCNGEGSEGGEGGGQGGGGEQELTDPTNCAEAREAALSVSGNNVEYNGGKEYTIEGYVTSIQTAYNAQYNNVSFWMADTKDGGQVLEDYRAACASAADAPNVGDKVAVTGKLTKYNSTPEFAAGCTFEIKERDVAPVNLGEKTIAEFLELKNVKDTCVLTGTVKNIVMDKDDPTVPNKYGNFDLEDETGTVYVYGLLNADGEAQKFVEMDIEEGDVLTIKAVYAEHEGKGQAKNALYVSHEKHQGTAIDNTAVEVKAQKVVRDGQLLIIRNGVVFNANGTIVK